jgi:hypothetical protein
MRIGMRCPSDYRGSRSQDLECMILTYDPGIWAALAIYLVRCAHAIVDPQADIAAAHSYQFSFEPNHSWSALYAPAREIQAYLERTAKKYSADRFIKLSHQINDCRWDDKTAKWHVQVKNLKTGEVIQDKADVLISARGNLNNPAWPEIEGLQTFKGEVMHSAKWNERCDLITKLLDGANDNLATTSPTSASALLDLVLLPSRSCPVSNASRERTCQHSSAARRGYHRHSGRKCGKNTVSTAFLYQRNCRSGLQATPSTTPSFGCLWKRTATVSTA